MSFDQISLLTGQFADPTGCSTVTQFRFCSVSTASVAITFHWLLANLVLVIIIWANECKLIDCLWYNCGVIVPLTGWDHLPEWDRRRMMSYRWQVGIRLLWSWRYSLNVTWVGSCRGKQVDGFISVGAVKASVSNVCLLDFSESYWDAVRRDTRACDVIANWRSDE